METREERDKRLGIRPRAKSLYPINPPYKGSYWKVARAYYFLDISEGEIYYFSTIKELIGFLETHTDSIVSFIRR